MLLNKNGDGKVLHSLTLHFPDSEVPFNTLNAFEIRCILWPMKQCTFLSDTHVPLIFVTFLNLKYFFLLKHYFSYPVMETPGYLSFASYFFRKRLLPNSQPQINS